MRYLIISSLIFFSACSQSSETEKDTEPTKVADTKTEEVKKEEVPVDEVKEIETPKATDEYTSDEYVDIDWLEYEASLTKDFSFVIIISTKDYDAALKRAKDASEKLGYPLDLRGLHPNDEMGLSLPEEVCEAICGGDIVDYPQYLPRNDWGDSKYVSIEYSNGFRGFTKGYYIVVVASGEKGDPVVNEALKEAKKHYSDAYAKTCGVWMGCGC